MTSIGILILMIIFISSCVEEVDWELQPGDNGKLVVESIITDQVKIQQVRLSQSFDDLNADDVAIDNALLQINTGSEVYPFRKAIIEPGLYLSREAFAARKDQIYTLIIFWNQEIYEASSELSFVAPRIDISFDRTNGFDSLKIRQVGDIYHPLEQAMYEIFVDWQPSNPIIPRGARLFYYTFSTIDGSEVFRPTPEEVFFPRGSRIIINKYGLDVGFAEYLRTLVMETQWQGGVFDEASSSLETNVSNGGLGYFSVCAVLSDTLIAR